MAARSPIESDAAKPAGRSLPRIVTEMNRDGVQTFVIHRVPNDMLAKTVQTYPTRFLRLATLRPFDGMRDLGHPSHLDRVAIDLSELRIIAECSADRAPGLGLGDVAAVRQHRGLTGPKMSDVGSGTAR
jgi:hypothetical protein